MVHGLRVYSLWRISYGGSLAGKARAKEIVHCPTAYRKFARYAEN